jgi:hypothetical protein
MFSFLIFSIPSMYIYHSVALSESYAINFLLLNYLILLTWYQSLIPQLAVAHCFPFAVRVGLDVLPPHVRGRVESLTLLGY